MSIEEILKQIAEDLRHIKTVNAMRFEMEKEENERKKMVRREIEMEERLRKGLDKK